MKYKYIFFDLDGTLTDPKLGITTAVQYALAQYGIEEESLDNLEKFIGPPLKDSFIEYYQFNEEAAVEAIQHYRDYFTDKGIFQNKVYIGIENMLKALKEKGCILVVATSKPTVFAEQILQHFNLDQYFELVIGSNLDGTRVDKKEIIQFALKELGLNEVQKVIMIGDRKHDIIGAHKNDIDSIGVTYGYGSAEELKVAKATYICNSVNGLYELIS